MSVTASGFGEIMILRLPVSVAGSSAFELLLRVREALVEVLDDLRLVGQRAQLGRLFAGAEVGAGFAPNEVGMKL